MESVQKKFMDRPHLEIETAAGRKQLVLTGEMLSIGRHADNHVVVTDTHASRFHCVIERTPQGYILRDLGSSNGTRVNGRAVRRLLLRGGDVVSIGKTRLILVLPDAPSRPTEVVAPVVVPVVVQARHVPGAAVSAQAIPLPPGSVPIQMVPAHAAPPPPARPNHHPAPAPTYGMDDDDAEPIELADLEELGNAAVPEPVYDADGLEVLSEADLIVEEPSRHADLPIPVSVDDNIDDYEKSLRTLMDALPDRGLRPLDVTLFNPRGHAIGNIGQSGAESPNAMIHLLRVMLTAALRARATDLHLEPRGDCHQLRMRVDGVMVDVVRLPNEVGARMVGVVKIASDIDPSQRNIIQEGHFSSRLPAAPGQPFGTVRRVDFRVSFAPAVFGQKLVLRVLDPGVAPPRLTDLNFPPALEKEAIWAIEQEAGMILVCGPTGSGKTSTLYALLRSINVRERNVVTIEDPVEIQLDGVTQIPVDDEKGNSFSNILRSVLRQDPDVILVGEIRDAETSRIAMQAAITGHLVFSTVHTKDAVGTVFRLLDLGVEPYLLAQGLHVVLAQRLVRQLCPVCKKPQPVTPDQRVKMGKAGEGIEKIYNIRGCARCLGTGYAGRRAFFEMLGVNDSLREAITRSPSLKEITQALSDTPFQRLQQSGYQLVAQGAVAFDEIEKVVGR